ncbi:hypothetical protein CHS0354_000312 [Potamilus streckersoni]|uniref:Uncharacterized protein n=1 Tax=Potamilus streckersoni TaxID=2493646 RepID=A0AAE0SBJ2_9BIVA|nr:hypothetical protein CHS0354_000312 [Potamilus streckersoni]
MTKEYIYRNGRGDNIFHQVRVWAYIRAQVHKDTDRSSLAYLGNTGGGAHTKLRARLSREGNNERFRQDRGH